jgi:hypothetical protein
MLNIRVAMVDQFLLLQNDAALAATTLADFV